MRGVGEVQQNFESIVMAGLLLLTVLMHNIEERREVQDGRLGIIFVILSQLPNLFSPAGIIPLHFLLIAVQLNLFQVPA